MRVGDRRGSAASWGNWAGTASARPSQIVTPRDAGEVAEAVRAAADRGGTVKMVGTGHSFSSIAAPEGVMLRPDGLVGVTVVDREAMTVTVLAGTPLHVLNRTLEELGLSLHNMGDIAAQTVAGAISTGTHGAGGHWASLSDQVAGLELVTGDGQVLHCSATEHPDLFRSARVGLGALGVITAITFRVEPLFVLEAVERPMPWDRALDELDHLVTENHHCDLYWFPHTDRMVVKTNNRSVDPAHPLGHAREWVEDALLANTVFGASNRLGNRVPRLIPLLNRASSASMARRSYSDVAHRVFTAERSVVFREMEYAVPFESAVSALTELRSLVERSGWRIGFPVEIRATPADDIPLSTSSGRRSVYLACHMNRGADHGAYFAGAERIFVDHGGRPHWGKVHTRTAEQLAPAYPGWGEFASVRDQVDPHRLFANDHLRRVLGP